MFTDKNSKGHIDKRLAQRQEVIKSPLVTIRRLIDYYNYFQLLLLF